MSSVSNVDVNKPGGVQALQKLRMTGSQKSLAISNLGRSAKSLVVSAVNDAEKRDKERHAAQESVVRHEQEELVCISIKDLIQKLNTNVEKGLTSHEVKQRLEQYGRNELDKAPATPLWRIFLEQFNDILVMLLIAACIVSAILQQPAASITIFVIVLLNAVVGVVQESKAGAALEALESLSADKAEVLRDGVLLVVDGVDLVPGDIINITTGQKLPADVRLIEAHSLVSSEMALTGESEGVHKRASDNDELQHATSSREENNNDDDDDEKKEKSLTSCNMVYMGCSILDGRGQGLVCTTGMQTRMGAIAKLLNEAESGDSPLQLKLHALGVKLGIASIIISLIVYIVGGVLGSKPDPTSDQSPWLQMLLVAVSLTVAAVPEGLPVALTITLALGMRRMVKKDALIRNLHSVETLGSATIICSDKTGTLTAGVMTAVRLCIDNRLIRVTGKGYSPTGDFIDDTTNANIDVSMSTPEILPIVAAVLCSNATLQRSDESNEWECLGNTSERPLVVMAAKANIDVNQLNIEYQRYKENPFSSKRKMMSTLVSNSRVEPALFPSSTSSTNTVKYLTFVKGAPNIVIEKCFSQLRIKHDSSVAIEALDKAQRESILARIDHLSSQVSDDDDDVCVCVCVCVCVMKFFSVFIQALRVLAFAYRTHDTLPGDTSPSALETELVLCGLVASMDPERDEVVPAIQAARRAGIRVCMITGDYVKTAKAIAENIHLLSAESLPDSYVDCEVVRAAGLRIQHCEKQLNTAIECKANNVSELRKRLHAELNALDTITRCADVYARAKPEDKITIVRSLQRQGNICSMTGDGVNDAPALKQANIGVAMGVTGTDVAKASADMVLTTDNFVSIVDAIEEGRTIYANIGKFVFYLLSTNVSEVFLLLLTIIIGLPVPLNAIQILWLNLATDGAPAVALAVELTDPGTMEQAPRDPTQPLIEKVMLTGICIQTFVLTSSCTMVYMIGLKWNTGSYRPELVTDTDSTTTTTDTSVDEFSRQVRVARTMTILLILFAELLRAHTCRSMHVSLWQMGLFSNPYMHVSVMMAISITIMLALVPWFQNLFGLEPLQCREWLLVLGVAVVPALVDECTKCVYRRTGFGKRLRRHNEPRDDVDVHPLADNLSSVSVHVNNNNNNNKHECVKTSSAS